MSISSEILRISGNISDALDEISNKGVTIPSGSNSDDLASLIRQISGGDGYVWQDQDGYVHLSSEQGTQPIVDSLTVSGSGTYEAPTGHVYDSVTVPSGSASTPATSVTANPSISVNSSGLITATTSATQSVTPSVSAGWVASGTSGTVTVSGSNTSQLSTEAGKTVTPTTSEQTAVASGKYTTGDIKVAAMPSGTAGTPTATKGTVSNHSVTVTPSVTNETGYITGGTKTGTAVTVSASELASGNKAITSSGSTSVVGYSTVSVSAGSVATPTGSKGTVSNNSVTVTPRVTSTTGYITGSTKTGSPVTVTASELVSGTKTITENGTGIDVTNYRNVDVSVSSLPPVTDDDNGDILSVVDGEWTNTDPPYRLTDMVEIAPSQSVELASGSPATVSGCHWGDAYPTAIEFTIDGNVWTLWRDVWVDEGVIAWYGDVVFYNPPFLVEVTQSGTTIESSSSYYGDHTVSISGKNTIMIAPEQYVEVMGGVEDAFPLNTTAIEPLPDFINVTLYGYDMYDEVPKHYDENLNVYCYGDRYGYDYSFFIYVDDGTWYYTDSWGQYDSTVEITAVVQATVLSDNFKEAVLAALPIYDGTVILGG